MADARPYIVSWALLSVRDPTFHSWFQYTEGPQRMADEHRPAPSHGPITCDCSAFVTYCYCWAGAPDPNGFNYNGYGYTGTLLLKGQHLGGPLEARAGDVVVYGPGTGVHAALIVAPGPNPLTVSHGHQNDPELVSVGGTIPWTSSVVTYLRYPTNSTNPSGPGGVPPVRPPVPGARPPGNPPLLHRGMLRPRPWINYLKVRLGMHRPLGSGFGPITEREVKKFQAAHNLTVDGIVGPMTWAALEGK